LTKKAFVKIAALASGLIVAAQPTFAWFLFPTTDCTTDPVNTVPEIDASSGLLALAAVGAALLFAWERRRTGRAL